MNTICKNCGTIFEGKYCNNCGQKADTSAINASFVIHDLQHGLFHFEGGMVYSSKELFTRPGHSIREYIEGKRKKHYKPISMAIVLATFYGLVYHLLEIDVFQGKEDELLNYGELNEWLAHHFSIITLCILPVLAFTSNILFKKQGYNFTEHLILNSFYSCQKLLVRILVLPIFVFLKPETILVCMRGLMFLDMIFMFWTYLQFFNKVPKLKVFFLSILASFINIILIAILTTLLLELYIIIKQY